MKTLQTVKQFLLRRQKEVEKEIEDLEKDDPVNSLMMAESSEPGTDSWVADTHSRVVAVKQNLMELLIKIRNSLNALKTGKYGRCDNCGNQIEEERLEAIPTATLCIKCSKLEKKSKK